MSKNACKNAVMKADCSSFYVLKTLNQFGKIQVSCDVVFNTKISLKYHQKQATLNTS